MTAPHERTLEALKNAVKAGLADSAAGRYTDFNASEPLTTHLKSLATKALERAKMMTKPEREYLTLWLANDLASLLREEPEQLDAFGVLMAELEHATERWVTAAAQEVKNQLVFYMCVRCRCLHRSANPLNFSWEHLQELRACSQCGNNEFARTEVPDDFETAVYPLILLSTEEHEK